MPKVSVIVPVYCAEKYLTRCVNSLICQKLQDIEIILVDDKSPDSCPMLCDQFAVKDNRIKVIHKEKNEGAGYARNSGLSVATGEYISFVDSDDYIEPELYTNVYNECISGNLDICYFRYRRIDEKGNSYTYEEDPNVYELFSKKDCYKIVLAMMGGDPTLKHQLKLFPSVWSGLFNKNTIKRSGVLFTSERCGEDFLFTVNLIQHTNRIKVLSDVYYNYFVNTNSLTTSYDDGRLIRVVKLIKYVKKTIPSDETFRNGFVNYILNNYKAVIRFEAKTKSSIKTRCKRINEICSMEILDDLYSFPIFKFARNIDRIIVLCMKYHLSLFFVFLYNVIYRKNGLK